MKKNYLLNAMLVGSATLGFLLACVLFYFFPLDIKSSGDQARHRIGIIIPASHPSIESISKGFQASMSNVYGIAAEYKIFNGNGNRALIKSQIEEVVQSDYDLIFTVGMLTSLLAKEITLKKKKSIPIVFSAVSRPDEMHLIDSYSSSGNNVTGIADRQNYEAQVKLLCTIKPYIKTVLLVYDPQQGSGLEKDKEHIREILARYTIMLKTVEVYSSSEIYGKVSGALQDVDVVLVLTDNTVVPAIDSLVKLCNRAGVTLYTSELDSVKRGAGMGCGVIQYDYGVLAAKQAASILLEGKKPAAIPIQFHEKVVLQINTKTMVQQQIDLSERDYLIAESVELVTP